MDIPSLPPILVSVMPQSFLTGSDFTNTSFQITIPPNEDDYEPSEFVIPQLFNITDDNVNEIMQSFVLVAEIGADVPERLTCFQREEDITGCNATMDPFARFGATKISIIDNDGKFDSIYCWLYNPLRVCIAAMIIGFSQRRQTVSEADRTFIQDQSFPISVGVMSMITSEINYNISFEAFSGNMGQKASVGDIQQKDILDYDALFGEFNHSTGNLQVTSRMFSGSTFPNSPLTVTIINDFTPEPQECFTMGIGIVIPDIVRSRDVYKCFNEEEDVDTFFCLHEICIEDDDG